MQDNAVREGAYGAARGQTMQNNERATAAQGFRSGTTRGQERRVTQDLGSNIATGMRNVRTQAALQRPQDIIAAIGAQLPLLAQQYQWPRDIAAAHLGIASNPINAQPSPLMGIGQGIGGLAGSLAGGGFFGPSSAGRGGKF